MSIEPVTPLPESKTRIVCTVGPASSDQDTLERMIQAGMNVARLNFSHGDLEDHRRMITTVRAASHAVGRRVAVMADLPGPKLRIGNLGVDAIELNAGDTFVLTTEKITGDREAVSVSFEHLPRVVKSGDHLFINDGLVQLEVERIADPQVECRVVVGGEIRSRKGLNLPGIDLGISAFTERDRVCLGFALGEGVDAVSQSFVESCTDIHAVRKAANAQGHDPFVIAKIERATALDHIEDILDAADGLMIARGDLGVEIPIEKIAGVQKMLMRRANLAGKPVITATQMLESMTHHRIPTRAEATDVANAILDGTDCVMLSGESAMGRYPVQTVDMLGRIARDIESHRPGHMARKDLAARKNKERVDLNDVIALSVEAAVDQVHPGAVIVQTKSGATARSLARTRPSVWILAATPHEDTCRQLQFTYGVHAVLLGEIPSDLKAYSRTLLDQLGLRGEMVIVAEGPSEDNPDATSRMGILDLRASG